MHDFVHLRVHSEYSIKDGLLRVKEMCAGLADLGMDSIALTDIVNLYGSIKFYTAAEHNKVKPILGAEIWLKDKETDDIYKPVLLCKNQKGYLNLLALLSKAYLEGRQQDNVLIELDWLLEHKEGLIILSGAMESRLGKLLLLGRKKEAKTELAFYLTQFADNFYLEVQRVGFARENEYIKEVVELALAYQVPLVATNNVCFMRAADYEAHLARVSINQGISLKDANKKLHYTKEQHLKSSDSMQKLFADLPQALENAVNIAKRCNVELNLGSVHLPNFAVPQDMTVASFLEYEANKGLEAKLEHILDKNDAEHAKKVQIYKQRLATELNVINSMGFPGYFLIVSDFIRYAKHNKIPVGPGRGSGAGSLVAYSLDITGLDPISYDLLFERFLNPERVSLPDFDIDFCMDNRDKVIEYVANKYGKDSVSQIITFGTMAAKAVVRDVGRVLGHAYGFVDAIAKLIPFELGMTLDKALEQEEMLANRYKKEVEVRELIDLARKLEGVVRNVGKHAGGVVIAPSKLTDFSAIYCEENADGVMTQLDKDDIEAAGLVKFDFLGLRTLTIIDWAVQNINKNREKDNKLDIETIPLDDKQTFELLCQHKTTAVFQLESRGMKELIAKLKPDSLDDIIALVALYRPGPLQSGMVDDFINRKHGKAGVSYPHPLLEPILKPTYGVILYQEQVMQIAQVLSGYTLGGADLLRRAMGKKKPEEMAKQRAIFTNGAIEAGVEAEVASYIFDLVEKFAGYGFNKSHSAAYGLISYQTAWLKAHYPSEFMAAVLSSDMNNTDKMFAFMEDCKLLKLKVMTPNINTGEYRFVPKSESEIIYGLGAIKGVGYSAIEHIVAARQQRDFLSLYDFCKRIDLKKVSRRTIESLIKAGAMDAFGNRAMLHDGALSEALALAEKQAKDRIHGQIDLFATEEIDAVEQALEHKFADLFWSEEKRLAAEKDVLGLYLTGHPMDLYKEETSKFTSSRIKDLSSSMKKARVAGFINTMKIMQTKKGDKMAFVSLEDETGSVEVAVFSDIFAEARADLIKGQPILLSGEISVDSATHAVKLRATKVSSLTRVRAKAARGMLLSLAQDKLNPRFLAELKKFIKNKQKGLEANNLCKVSLIYEHHELGARVKMELPNEYKLECNEMVVAQLQEMLGEGTVSWEY